MNRWNPLLFLIFTSLENIYKQVSNYIPLDPGVLVMNAVRSKNSSDWLSFQATPSLAHAQTMHFFFNRMGVRHSYSLYRLEIFISKTRKFGRLSSVTSVLSIENTNIKTPSEIPAVLTTRHKGTLLLTL